MDEDTFEKRYLGILKTLGRLAGIWPDQNKLVKYILWIILYSEIVTSVLVQITRIIHVKTVNVFIDHLPLIGTCLVFALKQGNYVLNATKYKLLLKSMYRDWTMDRSDDEIAIMSKYAKRGTILAMFYIVNVTFCSILFLQLPWTTRLLAWLQHSNTTPMIFVIPGYYFADEHEIFYLIQLHGSLGIIFVAIVNMACDSSFTIVVQHACGLLAVTGYRFKHAIESYSYDIKNSEQWVKHNERVRFSIIAHQRAIGYVQQIEDTHATYLFLCIGIVICSFSITLVKVATMDVCLDFYKYVSFLLIQLIHLFYLTIQGQFVENVCDQLYNKIYEALWYNTNVKTQLLYVLALRRMLTPPRLTAGGLIDMNMESFSEVVKLSVSYYTVIR
ncbi:odorant receptor 13a-like isoform X1 [Ceratina calcarata]|uniref:Odorant receptor n=1 Tax=Ceratina calcarata TaxID=156304 RepID=A0AAJ7S4E5_9HYME|nr:odorant receptor 13a-like isoform X1 [Ceratina calcarata]